MKKKQVLAVTLSAAMALGAFGAMGATAAADEVVTLKWVQVGNGMPENYDAWLAQINPYLEEKIGVNVDMEIVPWGDWENRRSVITNSGEYFDILFTDQTRYSSEVATGVLMDITELLPEAAPDLYSFIPEDYWKAVSVNDTIYGVPTYKDSSVTQYFIWDKDIADKYEIDIQSVTDFNSLYDALAKIKEGEGGSPYYMSKNGADFLVTNYFDQLGAGLSALGIRYDDETKTVVNPLEDEELLSALDVVHKMYVEGIINGDAPTADDSNKYRTFFTAQGWSGAAKSTWGPNNGIANCEAVQFGDTIVSNTSVRGSISGIYSGCEHPEKALELLQLVNTDNKVRDWLYYGVEGENFEYTEDGTVNRLNSDWSMAGYTQGTFFAVSDVAGQEGQWEFDRYCIKRDIELVPSLSTFGHLYKLLSTEQYRRYCELSDAGEQPFGFKQRMDHHTVDVSDEGAFSLICSMIRQFLPLFSSHRFNICADETFDLGKGKNTERAEKEGRDRLYIDYVKKLCAFIMDQGSTPMLWGDVLLGFPELAKELPKEAVCLNWGYAPDQSEDSTRIYAAAGVRQYVCPGVGGWNQFVNLQRGAYENISRMSRYGKKYGCEGLLNTDWGDFGHINHPAFCIPGLICGAAASWNRDALPSYDELNTQISVLQYSDTSGRFSAVTGQLAVQESFGWREAVMVKEVWEPQGMEVLYSELKLLKDKIESEPEKSEEIERCIRDLKLCTRTMSHEKRGEVYPYLIAAEGMRLFNRIGMIFWEFINKEAAQNTLARSKTLRQEAYETAGALEEWYYHYRMLWSSISRESELYRIGEVIFWYADALRKRVAANEW